MAIRRRAVWVIGAALSAIPFAACGSSSSNPGEGQETDAGSDAGCVNIAGDWTIVKCDGTFECTIIQAGCSISIGCQIPLGGIETVDGTLTSNTFLLESDSGSCTGEFLSTVASGTCQDYDAGEGGVCEFDATKK